MILAVLGHHVQVHGCAGVGGRGRHVGGRGRGPVEEGVVDHVGGCRESLEKKKQQKKRKRKL